VVVDNNGGGIFSFLPQATEVPEATFEAVFGTPHGTDLATLLGAHGVKATPWPLPERTESGVRATVVRTDRVENVIAHDEVNAAVVAALDGMDHSTP
ncbi:MAG: 2-succinyl-5-enolpyruvyl-6-hydroxy-3-cyclohexene-1-carboxylate synthase, partial [Actinomycetota bacterium]